MNCNRIIILFVLVVAIGVVAWLFLKGSYIAPSSTGEPAATPSATASAATVATAPSPLNEDEERKAVLEQVEGIFNAPIAFYGRVIDQYGEPVPHASVSYSMIDGFLSSSPGRHTTADERGNIVITGVRGASISVTVRKTGYYLIPNSEDRSQPTSSATFGYGIGSDSYRRPPPTKENPAVFVLHKMGEPAELIYGGPQYLRVDKDGNPTGLSLQTGRRGHSSEADVLFQRWTTDATKDKQGRFDWQLKISVPGGGIVKRESPFAFEAPEAPYEPVLEINMPAALGDDWRYSVSESYFVKLPNGSYGRIDVTIHAGHSRTPLVVKTYLNPELGDRNLEFDSEKVIKP